MRQCRLLTILCLLSLLTLPAGAQLAELSRGPLQDALSPVGACGAALATAPQADVAPAPLYFYSIPSDSLIDGENRITVKAFVDGELLVEETIRLQRAKALAAEERARENRPDTPSALTEGLSTPSGRTVFELLNDRAEVRSQLAELAASGRHVIEVEILVNDASVAYQGFGDFTKSGDRALESHGLPVATESAATVFSTQANPGPQNFEVCGDGYCAGGSPPQGEDCESCPQDCGGACSFCGNGLCSGSETCSTCPADCGSCPPCPEDLGTENRTDYLGSTSYSTYCFDGWPGKMYYTYQRNDYKHYTVQRTRQCDGTITETVVPGSTSYSSSYCYRPRWTNCSYSYGYASPICF